MKSDKCFKCCKCSNHANAQRTCFSFC